MADELPESVKRLQIGGIPVLENANSGEDNLAIALCTYFEDRGDCPEQESDESGWNPWAREQTDALLYRIDHRISLAIEESTRSLREELSHVLADWNALVAAIGSPTNGGAIGYARELRERLERAQADADRYRWLREASVSKGTLPASVAGDGEWWDDLGDKLGADFDAAIDLAIREAKESAK